MEGSEPEVSEIEKLEREVLVILHITDKIKERKQQTKKGNRQERLEKKNPLKNFPRGKKLMTIGKRNRKDK